MRASFCTLVFALVGLAAGSVEQGAVQGSPVTATLGGTAAEPTDPTHNVSTQPSETAAAPTETGAATFQPEVHAQYLSLPPLPTASFEDLTGSWKLSETVYNHAASLPGARVLSRELPRLVEFPSFLTPEEAQYLIRQSDGKLERSEVVADEEDSVSNSRTSFGYWVETDPVVANITERIHRVVGVPVTFGEGLYVLNYQRDQRYEAHNDHCMDGSQDLPDGPCVDFLSQGGGPSCGPGRGGPTCGDRMATFIIYLKSPTQGGKTAFPFSQATQQSLGGEYPGDGNFEGEWYCQDNRVLAATPAAGTALLFWDYRPSNGSGSGSYEDGSAQPQAQSVYEAMHSGCPVTEGEKYIVTRWIRSTGFDVEREEEVESRLLLEEEFEGEEEGGLLVEGDDDDEGWDWSGGVGEGEGDAGEGDASEGDASEGAEEDEEGQDDDEL